MTWAISTGLGSEERCSLASGAFKPRRQSKSGTQTSTSRLPFVRSLYAITTPPPPPAEHAKWCRRCRLAPPVSFPGTSREKQCTHAGCCPAVTVRCNRWKRAVLAAFRARDAAVGAPTAPSSPTTAASLKGWSAMCQRPPSWARYVNDCSVSWPSFTHVPWSTRLRRR